MRLGVGTIAGDRGLSRAVVVVVVVCLSVTRRTSPGSLIRSRRNFRRWSGSWSGTFISGSGPVGQGSVKKRAGNSNFEGGATIEVAVSVCMLAVTGDQVLPDVARM